MSHVYISSEPATQERVYKTVRQTWLVHVYVRHDTCIHTWDMTHAFIRVRHDSCIHTQERVYKWDTWLMHSYVRHDSMSIWEWKMLIFHSHIVYENERWARWESTTATKCLSETRSQIRKHDVDVDWFCCSQESIISEDKLFHSAIFKKPRCKISLFVLLLFIGSYINLGFTVQEWQKRKEERVERSGWVWRESMGRRVGRKRV